MTVMSKGCLCVPCPQSGNFAQALAVAAACRAIPAYVVMPRWVLAPLPILPGVSNARPTLLPPPPLLSLHPPTPAAMHPP
jgi:hypothetical protein